MRDGEVAFQHCDTQLLTEKTTAFADLSMKFAHGKWFARRKFSYKS